MVRGRVDIVRVILAGLVTIVFIISDCFAAPDYAREQRWADEITPAIIIGEPIYLEQSNKHRFLGIYSEAEQAGTALVIVHGMGLHPDWGLISTLRQELVDFGYSTLAIQMPVLAADAGYQLYPDLFQDAAERLQIAIAYLKRKNYQHIAIISHSNGSRMSRVYLAGNPEQVNAWISLSLTQGDTFADIRVPVLDLYGEHDLPHVLSATDKRKVSLAGNSLSKQQSIAGADHFFAGYEQQMLEAVKQFLAEVDLLQKPDAN